ncbi:Oligosaccharyl transferase STT3 subunit [Sulfidibacter corallicola]|uniref:Uncharacterized protein n=1 Tax=Sulfidibacter corallicola TaxID=2818388 RepID=A0A8A4TJW2_SULCO|nr:STT3 domain-containing protein [Sulfidibacter corallicola]QTD49151.1 hypothetical protein J3U87_26495 [Sulfidibacter corallicola]
MNLPLSTRLRRLGGWTPFHLFLIVTTGFFLRSEDLPAWLAHPDAFFFDGQGKTRPLLLNLDGYHYLREASEAFSRLGFVHDPQRIYPEGVVTPLLPSFPAVCVASLGALLPFSLDWIAVWLPVLLGAACGAALYRLARELDLSKSAAWLAGMLAAASPIWVERTRLGFFDTDAFILCSLLMLVGAYLRLARDVEAHSDPSLWRRPGFWIACLWGWSLLWSWDSARHVVAAIWLTTHAGFLARCRLRGSRLVLARQWVAIACILVPTWGFQPQGFLTRTRAIWDFVMGTPDRFGFPHSAVNIHEMVGLGPLEVAAQATHFGWVALLAIPGWILAVREHRERLLPMIALAALTMLPFFLGRRYCLFLVPVVMLGLAMGFDAWSKRSPIAAPRIGLPSSLVLLFVMASPQFRQTQGPLVTPHLKTLRAAADILPEDALVWTSWNLGFPLGYYTRATTFADGHHQQGDRQHYLDWPLVQPDQRLAANFMRFYSVHGLPGMRYLLRAMDDDPARVQRHFGELWREGPTAIARMHDERSHLEVPNHDAGHSDDSGWRDYLFPTQTRPLFLILDRGTVANANWQFWFGTWDFARGQGTEGTYWLLTPVTVQDRTFALGNKSLFTWRDGGTLRLALDAEAKAFPLATLAVHDGKNLRITEAEKTGGYHFEYLQPRKTAVVTDAMGAASVLNSLFLRHTMIPAHFEPVALKSPDYQFWRVRGDAPASGTKGRSGPPVDHQ